MSKHATYTYHSWGRKVLTGLYRNRRRLATGSATMLAAVLGYCAIAGGNGVSVYRQKKVEDRHLARTIQDLKQENARLQSHVDRLQSDPAAIEHEAREKLHYTRPGEVIYTLRDLPGKDTATSTP